MKCFSFTDFFVCIYMYMCTCLLCAFIRLSIYRNYIYVYMGERNKAKEIHKSKAEHELSEGKKTELA